jgi:hypothetical protein
MIPVQPSHVFPYVWPELRTAQSQSTSRFSYLSGSCSQLYCLDEELLWYKHSLAVELTLRLLRNFAQGILPVLLVAHTYLDRRSSARFSPLPIGCPIGRVSHQSLPLITSVLSRRLSVKTVRRDEACYSFIVWHGKSPSSRQSWLGAGKRTRMA